MARATTSTIPFAEAEEIFLRKHPELESLTPILLGTYRTCQADKLHGRMRVDVEEAFHHIFVDKCSWCQLNFKSVAAFQEEFFK